MAPSASEASATGVIARRGRRRAFGGPPRPPRDGDGGGGGGGDDHGGFAAAGGPGDVGPFALGLALTGITTLFFVLIAVWLFLRRPAPDWHPASAPRALWLSTLFLAASSLAVERAARAARREEQRTTRRWLGASLALGLAFLAAQALLWTSLWRAGFVPAAGGYAAVFFALTGLHALHVLGGLVFLAFLAHGLRRARRVPSVRLGAIYWHYMGAIWLVLFTLLVFVR